MRATRFAACAAAVIAVLSVLMVAGCGGGLNGRITQSVTSQWYGSLDQVLTIPPDPDLIGYPDVFDDDVPLDAWINVYWPDPYAPPRQFTVRLEKEESPGEWGGVHTRYSSVDSDPGNADWWFDPVSNFSPFTAYRIVIQAPGEDAVVVYFQTSDWYLGNRTMSTRSAASATTTTGTAKKYRPANAVDATGEGTVTHTITVPPKK